MLLGCIADDLTGATDLSLMLTREGLRTVQATVIPDDRFDLAGADALVIALKSRSIPAPAAVAASLEAAHWLRAAGASRFFFKYCSTFDSTDAGNIGPVLEALLSFTGAECTIACPAFPQAGRTVYSGHLFVNGALLSESPLRDHPLNPMRDPDLRRVLGRQTGLEVGLVSYSDVDGGPARVADALAREAKAGRRVSIVDALEDRHLRTVGAALAHLDLLTGGSGLAMGLPAAYRDAGLVAQLTAPSERMAAPAGREAILAGSCSAATREQISVAIAAGIPAWRINVDALANGLLRPESVVEWAERQDADRPVLIYSSADPREVGDLQAKIGREESGAMIERLLAATALGLSDRGFTRLLVAGGETSGAVVEALGTTALTIGPEIDPGVPWTRTLGGRDMALSLKSGNFGGADFFLRAWKMLE